MTTTPEPPGEPSETEQDSPTELLELASSSIQQAESSLANWEARVSKPGRPYAAYGQHTVECIDQALATLRLARAAMITELQADAQTGGEPS